MSERLIYQKPIDDVGLFRVYMKYYRENHVYIYRLELLVCKDLDTNEITVELSDKDTRALSIIRYAITYLLPYPVSKNPFYEINPILDVDVVFKDNHIVFYPITNGNINRGVYSSAYILDL